MKITTLAFVFLFALTSKPVLGAATGATPEAVFDTSGRKLRVGANYYIFPDGPEQYGGGLDLASIGESCPLDVVAVEGNSQGQPLSFTPYNANKGIVHVSTDLNIEFSSETECPQSNVWMLDKYDYSTGQWFVTTGGVIGNPGRRTLRNWFKIEEYEDAYKLVYCPDVCRNCGFQCKDIGFYVDDDGNKRLALSDEPIKVQFQRGHFSNNG